MNDSNGNISFSAKRKIWCWICSHPIFIFLPRLQYARVKLQFLKKTIHEFKKFQQSSKKKKKKFKNKMEMKKEEEDEEDEVRVCIAYKSHFITIYYNKWKLHHTQTHTKTRCV